MRICFYINLINFKFWSKLLILDIVFINLILHFFNTFKEYKKPEIFHPVPL